MLKGFFIWQWTSFKLVQLLKACIPMDVTEEGSVMDARVEHPLNALPSILVTVEGMVY